jgi:iron complex transport system ATP-binding protein
MTKLEFLGITFSYLNGPVLQGIDLKVKDGERVGLLGPNGSGKTTLLKLGCGVLRPGSGEVRLDGGDLNQLNRRAIAQRVAVVPQHLEMPFAFTAEQMVNLGRTPFVGRLSGERAADREAVESALASTSTSALAGRLFNELSGGERQKVILAMALAQEPQLLILDEPTVHLDINHQAEILDLVKRLNEERGLTIIAAMHDLNLASIYFDRLLIIKHGRLMADGPPEQVITESNLRDIFGVSVQIQSHPTIGRPQISPTPGMFNNNNHG